MQVREEARPACNIPELISRHKCGQKTCPNYDHNCLVINASIHHTLSTNDFSLWDKAIKDGKASLDLPPLSIRGSPITNRKSNVANSISSASVMSSMPSVMQGYPAPYPFMPGGYPMPNYPPYPYPPQRRSVTPIQDPIPAIQSSPVDFAAHLNKMVSKYMDWMIKRTPNDVNELSKVKNVFITDMVDLQFIKAMTKADYADYSIPKGLGRHLSRDVGTYIHETV